MIKFRQKQFSEYDAMRSLYVELMKDPNNRKKFGVIDQSALIPILKGNNVVIERFVISTSFLKKDRYRMYLKIGAKAKLPDDVRLPGNTRRQNYGKLTLKAQPGVFKNKPNDPNQQGKQSLIKSFSIVPIFKQKTFDRSKKNNNNNGGGPILGGTYSTDIYLEEEVQELLGDAIKYDKKGRSLVLEFNTIQDAIRALNILPFGLNYKIYLLDV